MNLPPKSLKQQIARNGAPTVSARMPDSGQPIAPGMANNAQVPTMRSASDLANMDNVSADSLPVLQAFQDFLESERKHARRQIMAITSFFLLLFVIIAGAGAFFGYVYFGKMNNEIAFLHGQINQTKSTMKIERAELLAGFTDRTDALSTRIVDGDVLIKQATSEISNTFSNTISTSQAELNQIRDSLASLEQENKNLRRDLALISVAPPATSPALAMASSTSTPVSQPTVRKIPKPPASSDYSPLEIAILAPGSSNAMKWRIPISE